MTNAASLPALTVSLALMALGVVFVVAPELGAAIFGLAPPRGEAAAWPAVVGIRDLAFGLYVLVLLRFATLRAAGIVLAVTALIPLADAALLMAVRGRDAGWHLLLHLLSFAAVAGAAAWTLRAGRR